MTDKSQASTPNEAVAWVCTAQLEELRNGEVDSVPIWRGGKAPHDTALIPATPNPDRAAPNEEGAAERERFVNLLNVYGLSLVRGHKADRAQWDTQRDAVVAAYDRAARTEATPIYRKGYEAMREEIVRQIDADLAGANWNKIYAQALRDTIDRVRAIGEPS